MLDGWEVCSYAMKTLKANFNLNFDIYDHMKMKGCVILLDLNTYHASHSNKKRKKEKRKRD